MGDGCKTGRGSRIINLGFGGQFRGVEATGATAVCRRSKQTGPSGVWFLKLMAVAVAVKHI